MSEGREADIPWWERHAVRRIIRIQQTICPQERVEQFEVLEISSLGRCQKALNRKRPARNVGKWSLDSAIEGTKSAEESKVVLELATSRLWTNVDSLRRDMGNR
jgi:hypothetical protein